MKNIIGLFCLCIWFNAAAQEMPDEVNEIVVSTDLSYEETYDFITKDLLVKGYSLSEAYPEGGKIETLPFLVRWGFVDADMMKVRFRYQLNRVGEKTQVTIMGEVDLDKEDSAYPPIPINNSGREDSAMRTAWQMMNDLAQRLPADNMNYRTNRDL